MIATISEITNNTNLIRQFAINYGLFTSVEKLILIALLSSLTTFVFHKNYKTENKVIYKIFNLTCSLIFIILFDVITIIGSTVYRLDLMAIIGELLQVIFIPFLSQCWYDWWKEFYNMIKSIINEE